MITTIAAQDEEDYSICMDIPYEEDETFRDIKKVLSYTKYHLVENEDKRILAREPEDKSKNCCEFVCCHTNRIQEHLDNNYIEIQAASWETLWPQPAFLNRS